MSTKMEEDVKRWTAKRKAALVMDIMQGKTTVAEASRSFDIAPSEIEAWVDDAKKGMEAAPGWRGREPQARGSSVCPGQSASEEAQTQENSACRPAPVGAPTGCKSGVVHGFRL